jgi:23S rRNA pseudouridine1911/1915/1917 synthase
MKKIKKSERLKEAKEERKLRVSEERELELTKVAIRTIKYLDVTEEKQGERLDTIVQEFLGETRAYVQKIIVENRVEILGNNKIKNSMKLKGNEKIKISIPEDSMLDIKAENLPLNIIREDKDLIVINKSPGMIVHPAQGYTTGTLVNAILYHVKDLSGINGIIRPGIVHRLDKDTSGAIIIAKNDKAHLKLSDMFKNKHIEKIYICIVKGIFTSKSGRIETLIGRNPIFRKKMAVVEENGKNAITNYEVIDEQGNFSLLKVRIETGRTHQIRVHMKYLNHPIIGDNVYGNESEVAKRQMLHAYNLRFKHPIEEHEINILAEIPEDFKESIRKLKLNLDLI